MRTLRILLIPASIALFSGALIALPGCGSADADRPMEDKAAITESREAREAYAKSEKKATSRRSTGRGSDPRG